MEPYHCVEIILIWLKYFKPYNSEYNISIKYIWLKQ